MVNFLSAYEFNRIADLTRTNCVAFAFGKTEPDGPYELDFKALNGKVIPIILSFKRKAKEFNIKVRKAYRLEQLKGKTGFVVFGWHAYYGDFHVARINSDGSIEHKPDWEEPASSVSSFDTLLEEFPGNYYLFVMDNQQNSITKEVKTNNKDRP